jgi:alpha-amylase
MRLRVAPLLVAPVVALGTVAAASPAPAGEAAPGATAAAPPALTSLRPPLTRENFYFVMTDRFRNGDRSNDRGGLTGDREVTGFDPTKKGWYHGGDLRGLINELGYIQGLGTTTIWLTPSFKNKPVQGQGLPYVSAGYHGYWVTDFTQIDPHMGTNAELRELIDKAHRRGIKIFFDIITNHTADVNDYRERQYAYVSKAEQPYRTAAGRPFDDRDYAGTNTFPRLDVEVSFPYTPFVRAAERGTKRPAWLNDLTLYHNRGDTTFEGENSLYGDFFGLDDLFTEHPRVVRGMQDIYDTWIRDFGVDGFRIDTMKHVNIEFWQSFLPHILRTARTSGNRDFFAFGEVAEPFDTRFLSKFTTSGKAQSVLDFTFQQQAREFAGQGVPTTQMGDLFTRDDWYTDADSNAYQLPTFLGNHDGGRIGFYLREDTGGAPEGELLKRSRLAHALMYFSRGNPVVYYGDEQGFTGVGGDQAARQDMGPSRDKEYNNIDDDEPNPDGSSNNDGGKNDNIGSNVTPMVDNFDPGHPLYQTIAALARVTKRYPALRDGAQQLRLTSPAAGLLAFSRTDAREQVEHVVVLNNATVGQAGRIPTYSPNMHFARVFGQGPLVVRSGPDGRIDLALPRLSTGVYRAVRPLARSQAAPGVSLQVNGTGGPRPEVRAAVRGTSMYQATFYVRPVGTSQWSLLGTDDNAPYRVFPVLDRYRQGTRLEFLTVVKDNAGHVARATASSAR